MENKNNSVKITKRKIVGLISLLCFSLAFIFSCMKNILPVGAWLVGTFGLMTYPMCLIFAFISLAMFLGFSYRKNKKPLAYFVIAFFAIILAIHSIKTYKTLDSVVAVSNIKNYLNLSYENLTLVGSFGSMICSFISILLGGMGTIVIFIILATIFLGVLLDYEIYGKYHDEHIKKLKTRKIREKVNNSDNKVSVNGTPNYSFEQNKSNSNFVEDEIVVDANNYESQLNSYETLKTTEFDKSDVIDEISTSIDDGNNVYDFNYQSVNNGINQETNAFSNNVYQSEKIPDVYNSSDMNEYRRQFMKDTFGTTSANASVEDYQISASEWSGFNTINEPNVIEEKTQNDFDFNMSNDNENEFDTQSDSSIDDDFSKFLNTSDFEIEKEIKSDVVNNFENKSFNENMTSFDEKNNANYTFTNNNNENNQEKPRYGAGFNPIPIDNFAETKMQNPVNFGNGFSGADYQNKQKNMSNAQREIKPNRFVSEIGMPGVRYNKPVLSLLRMPIADKGDYTAEQNRKTMLLENVLEAFGIQAKVVNIVRGPKITRYELALPLGTSVRKIPSYEDDIAAALAAKTITIKAPIPGSRYVGIELENDTFTTVYQRELLESDAFQNCKDPLPIAIGKDISGEIVVRSLVDMVHLLIAGSTGSGKSVFIHNIVLSLIFKSSPDDLRLIMIDPKKVEFPIYNGLPHLLTPEVVAGSQKALNALKWCVREMDRRYDLMQKAGFNNIKNYNKSEIVKAGQFEKLPYIVIIVDELAEVMMANKKEAEAYIQRITQLARACGMHMVLATQRPSVDIITGVIKNNIPSRIAFSLQSGIDSKTILTTVGAEKLLGKGDMIFAPTGTSAWPRLQASYATDDEIKAVIEYTIKNNYANFDETVESAMNSESSSDDASGVNFNGGDGVPPQKDALDSYFKVAVKMVMQNGGASTSYLQRRLSIGYSRAAKIMDQMSDKGFIAQANGSKQRKILITPDMFRNEFGEEFDSID